MNYKILKPSFGTQNLITILKKISNFATHFLKLMKEKILFIVNPVSGGKAKDAFPAIVKHYFEEDSYSIIQTNRSGHATEIVKKGIIDGYTQFVAVGGDGTVNEIAKSLINTDFKIGIIPFGSGNGLARHNKIPMDLRRAISTIKEGFSIKIDTCLLNGNPFVNMAGVGFDAYIGSLFGKDKKRGFKSYIKTTTKEFNSYKSQDYKITIDGKTFEEKAFLVSFANSSQYGNNAYISPEADIADGKLNVTLLKPFQFSNVPELVFRLFLKNIHKSKLVKTFIASQKIVVERISDDIFHLDGEPFMGDKILDISILPSSLQLIVPESVAKQNSKNNHSKMLSLA